MSWKDGYRGFESLGLSGKTVTIVKKQTNHGKIIQAVYDSVIHNITHQYSSINIVIDMDKGVVLFGYLIDLFDILWVRDDIS